MNFEETIRTITGKVWRRHDLHREWLRVDKSRFPWRINLVIPTGKKLVEQFEALQIEVAKLKSCQHQNPYFDIEYTEISNRLLGRQRIPKQVIFSSSQSLLDYLRKRHEWTRFTTIVEKILTDFPALQDYLIRYPSNVLEYENKWQNLLDVCRYRCENPTEPIYLRQISIPNIDTKFIENHKGLLKDLFDLLLPKDSISSQYVGLRNHGFEQRFGFLYDPGRIRIRILDKYLAAGMGGITDLEIPLTQAEKLNLPISKVFITENKMNGLSFPESKSAVVLFGLGYGIQILKTIPWLKHKSLYYWGDIDTHGFNILSKLRAIFPNVKSFLMNEAVLQSHRNSWVRETTPFMSDSLNLNETEQKLYDDLVNNYYGESVRLEQERIRYSDVVSVVERL